MERYVNDHYRTKQGSLINKGVVVFLLLTLAGCTTVNVPNYIRGDQPYKKNFYAEFDNVHDSVIKAFKEFGWIIEKETEPGLYERDSSVGTTSRQTLLFTNIRQTSLLVGARYARLNAYIRSVADRETEVEIRYAMVTAVPLKAFTDYTNDKAVERIFKRLEEILK